MLEPEPSDEQVEAAREYIDRRNREIGLAIMNARMAIRSRRGSMSACARLLGMDTRRLSAIENGKRMLSSSQLEVLINYLGMSPREVFPQDVPAQDGAVRYSTVRAWPGETVQIVVSVAEDNPETDAVPRDRRGPRPGHSRNKPTGNE
jgi:transcriptional regulator with XRE-family HTH domain